MAQAAHVGAAAGPGCPQPAPQAIARIPLLLLGLAPQEQRVTMPLEALLGQYEGSPTPTTHAPFQEAPVETGDASLPRALREALNIDEHSEISNL